MYSSFVSVKPVKLSFDRSMSLPVAFSKAYTASSHISPRVMSLVRSRPLNEAGISPSWLISS